MVEGVGGVGEEWFSTQLAWNLTNKKVIRIDEFIFFKKDGGCLKQLTNKKK
jgi:hypothetical protein